VLSFVWNHPANSRHRVRSVARAVRFQAMGRLGMRAVTRVGRHGRMWVDLHSAAAAKTLYANPPDWNEMQAWRRLLAPGDLFVDVGSNVGSYALWAADGGAEVIAVEPCPDAARLLRENVALNAYPISVRECGVADRPGRMRLSRGKGTTNHLLVDAPIDVDGVEVEVDTLDNLLGARHAAGVKIDVEGAERLVLQGATRALADRRIGVLQIEWNDMSRLLLNEDRMPIADLLRGHGYRLARPDTDGWLHEVDPPPASIDDLFAVAPDQPLRSGRR
jgi:FkbM family methyltransferase